MTKFQTLDQFFQVEISTDPDVEARLRAIDTPNTRRVRELVRTSSTSTLIAIMVNPHPIVDFLHESSGVIGNAHYDEAYAIIILVTDELDHRIPSSAMSALSK